MRVVANLLTPAEVVPLDLFPPASLYEAGPDEQPWQTRTRSAEAITS